MTAGELCNRNIVVVRPDASVVHASELMRAHHVGDLVVVDRPNGELRPIGILTDRDIALALDRLIARPEVQVLELMTADLVTATEDEDLTIVLKRMKVNGVRRLPVLNGHGGLEGILTFDDVVELLSTEMKDLATLVAEEQSHERLRIHAS